MSKYDDLTNKFIQALNAGIIPWRKPWNGSKNAPYNLASGRKYGGFNKMLLATERTMHEYKTPAWVTYKGAKDLGGHIRKGERGAEIIYYKRVAVPSKTDPDEPVYIPLLKTFIVFNVDQCEGIELPVLEETVDIDPIEACDALIDGYPEPPRIIHDEDGDRACYSPTMDMVSLPAKHQFETPSGYYATLFHELGHSTGHEDRLARELSGSFGSEKYAREELVAEITACFMMSEAGMEMDELENSQAYIQGWIKKLQNDPKMITWAAGRAEKATEWMLGTTPA